MTGSLNYTKILLSASIIAFVAAAVFGGTQAFFSDEETSVGNVFAAGAIDLLVDSEQHYAGLVCNDQGEWEVEDEETGTTREDLIGEPCPGTWEETDLGPEHTFFDFSDLKPGDSGENTISLHVIDNDAYMCAIIDNMETQDNGCSEPELGAEEDEYGEGNETCGDPGEGEGELQNELHFFAWTDDGSQDGWQNSDEDEQNDDPEEGDNIWQEGEDILFSNVSGPASDVIDGVVYPLYTPETGPITGTTTNYIGLFWCYGEVSIDGNELSCDGANASNITQTDSLSADITFYAEQARNNENFECPGLPLPEAETEEGQGFSNVDTDDLGGGTGKEWFAKARNNNGGFEVAVGSDDATVPGQDTADTTWTAGVSNPFTLSYDGAGTATMTAGGETTTYVVDELGYSRIGITVKAPDSETTTVENLVLDVAAPLTPDTVSVTGGTSYLTISGIDLDQAWTLTGDFTFSAVGTPPFQQENPAVQFSID